MISKKSKKKLEQIMLLKGECTKYILNYSNDTYRDFALMFGNVFPLLPHDIELTFDVEGELVDLSHLFFTHKHWVSHSLKPIIIGAEINGNSVYLYRTDNSDIPDQISKQVTECIEVILDKYEMVTKGLVENLEKRKELEGQKEFGLAMDDSYFVLKENA